MNNNNSTTGGLSVAQVGRRLNIGSPRVRVLLADGRFPGARKDDHGCWVIPEAALSPFLAARQRRLQLAEPEPEAETQEVVASL